MAMVSRLMNLFRRSRLDREIAEELGAHIEMRIEDNIAHGMSPEQARREAQMRFGNATVMREKVAAVDASLALENMARDARFALRRLRKSPGFAVTVLLTLAIGIGANAAVFSVLNSVLLRPLPYPHSDRLIALWLDAPGAGGLSNFQNGLQLSPSMYLTFSRRNQSFHAMGVWYSRNASVTGLAQPEEVHSTLVSGGVLEALSVPAIAGRWFNSADQDPNGAKTAMLGYGYWQRRFGGDRSAVGRSIQVDGITREIVGVMPRGFRVMDEDFDVMLPLAFDPQHQKLAPFGYSGLARLKDGVSIERADADISRLIGVWMDSWSNGPGTNPHYYQRWHITPKFKRLKDQVIGNVSGVLWIVMATVGLVMLIACTNVANLLLVRAESRQQELTVRAALGASRARIARELLVESVLLGMLGGLVGVGVAYAGLRLLVSIGPSNLPRLSEISFDARSLLFTLALSVLAGLLFGSIPAWRYARAKAALSSGSRTASVSRTRQRTRNALVVAQVAMALVLLVSALLMIRTFAALRNVEPGFTGAAHLETMRIAIPETMISDEKTVLETEQQIADKIAAVPGVKQVSFAVTAPMEDFDANWDTLSVEGKNYEGGEPPLRMFNYVAPGFFSTMGTRIVAGRDFTWPDLYGMRPMVLVSENFARENWGSATNAIGKRVRQFTKMPWQEVIGVVEDVRVHGVDEKAPALIYWGTLIEDPYKPQPQPSAARAVRYMIRSDRAGTEALLSQVQQAVWSVNANLPVASPGTMQEIYSQSMARTSFTLVMLAIAGSMALLLGVIGIYGVISYAVSQRTREIGIRLALGAQKSELRWMFVRFALTVTGLGVALGLVAAAGLTKLMSSLLFGVSPRDPVTFITVPLLLLAAAAVASYLPAWHASAVNPVEALRAE
ncbi:ABC transporter permease [Occallatibacter riparius]|uniref:ABC transporter permease n=1 Tax=Occallatibacter riparius TaxID=1002689 RepID=A0A9J7BTE0_9BACT|nr:ABC transporter permease [Occallatibacter riparius]UWZ85903.1 ABC transporter permease [Occallatibacter riparius]